MDHGLQVSPPFYTYPPLLSHVTTGRVPGHLQRHAALDGAGAVPAGDIESLGAVKMNDISTF